MLRILLILLAPLLLLLVLEAAFEIGIWEPLAEPMSHAGTSVRLKRALSDPAIPRIDYVTIGSSRPEYGIDHAMLAATARQVGRVHANLAMPGSHWLTIGLLSEWLQRAHPEVRGGIIALSIQDLINPGNGTKVDYPTGNGPVSIAYDGTNIWVVNYASNSVSKMNPATGTKLDIPTGSFPQGATYDGTNIWVTNYGSNTVSKLIP